MFIERFDLVDTFTNQGSKVNQPLTRILGEWFFFGASPDAMINHDRGQDVDHMEDPDRIISILGQDLGISVQFIED